MRRVRGRTMSASATGANATSISAANSCGEHRPRDRLTRTRPRCRRAGRTEDRFPNCVAADSKLSQRRRAGGPSAESAAATASEGSCPTRAPSSSEALVADRGRPNGVPYAGRRWSFAQSARVARPGSNPSHGAYHRGAQKPVTIAPRIAVIITGPQTIIITAEVRTAQTAPTSW
jgi:hypothetical protein